jgi:hypothetical protein
MGRVLAVHAHGSSSGLTPSRQWLVARNTGHDRPLFESPRMLRIHRRFRAGDITARAAAAGLWHRRVVTIETSTAGTLDRGRAFRNVLCSRLPGTESGPRRRGRARPSIPRAGCLSAQAEKAVGRLLAVARGWSSRASLPTLVQANFSLLEGWLWLAKSRPVRTSSEMPCKEWMPDGECRP